MRAQHALPILLALLALVLGACGGDQEAADVRPVSTPELTLPTDGGASSSRAGGDATSTTDTTDTTDTTATGTEPTTSDTAQSGGASAPTSPDTGGQSAPGAQAPADSETNDQPPPQGSPAEKFEDFCQQNPGAC